jgi:hypothetical protein
MISFPSRFPWEGGGISLNVVVHCSVDVVEKRKEAPVISKTLLVIAICPVVTAAQPSSGELRRVLTFAQADTPQTMQEMANTLRAVANIQQVSVDSTRKTLTIDTSPAQADLGEWIFKVLDSTSPPSGSSEYTVPGNTDDVVRVFFMSHTNGPRELQERVNALRSIVEVQRITAVNPVKALVVRGRVWQASLSEWLIRQLEDPPAGQSSAAYTATGVDPTFKARGLEDPVAVRVYYMPPGIAPTDVQNVVNQLRSQLQIMRIVACTAPQAVVLRATESQAQASDRMLIKTGN